MCEVTVVGKLQCSGEALFNTNNAVVVSDSCLTRYWVKTTQKGGPVKVGTNVKAFHTASSIKSSQIKWTRQTPGGEIVRQFQDATFFLGVVRRIQAKQKEKKWTEKFWRKGKKSTLLRKYEVKVR